MTLSDLQDYVSGRLPHVCREDFQGFPSVCGAGSEANAKDAARDILRRCDEHAVLAFDMLQDLAEVVQAHMRLEPSVDTALHVSLACAMDAIARVVDEEEG